MKSSSDNREIKFMAWDKVNNRMWIVPELNLALRRAMIGITENDDGSGEAHYMSFDDLILLQYTGLRDKHGKEIYEGNLVEVCFSTFFRKGEILEVSYDDGCGGFSPFVFVAQEMTDPLSSEESIIVGNIYENPELLNGK